MNVIFESLEPFHQQEVMDIFNYYIENSFAAYPETKLPYSFFNKFVEIAQSFPAFVLKTENKVAGFCFLRAYNPFPAFNETVEISYFIAPEYTGKGLGKIAFEKLEQEAKKKNMKTILASISSKNMQSIAFHTKMGFNECGRFRQIGKKFGKYFDVVWMMKSIK
jgi:L-amino acid N-acyltransferase YncA